MKRNFIYIYIFTCIAIFSSSCSLFKPENRIARIAKKYNLYTIDTLHYRDTIYIPPKTFQTETQIDTMGRFSYSSDVIEYQGFIKDSLIYITVSVAADTVYIEKKIPATKIEVKPDNKGKWRKWGVNIFAFLFGLVGINYISNKIKSLKNKQ